MEPPKTIRLLPADLGNIDTMTFKNEHLLVRLYPKREETESGIELPESAQSKRFAAWILAVASDITDPDYVVGNTISAGAYALDTPAGEIDGLPLDKTPLRILKASEVVSVMPPMEEN